MRDTVIVTILQSAMLDGIVQEVLIAPIQPHMVENASQDIIVHKVRILNYLVACIWRICCIYSV